MHPENIELISSGTMGRDFFFFFGIRLAVINCVRGLSHRVSGVHSQSSAVAL